MNKKIIKKWWKIDENDEKSWNLVKNDEIIEKHEFIRQKWQKIIKKIASPPKIPYESNVKKMAKKVIKMTKNHDFNEKRWKIEKIDKKMKILIKICKNWWKL